VWKTLPLTEAAEAHRLMEQRRHSGKLVLIT
jgi:NADPH:quinone reductase-like Zn-dependent oxidoreductase